MGAFCVSSEVKTLERYSLRDVTAPGTPPDGFGYVYVTSDDIYFKDDSGTATSLTSGGGGGGLGTNLTSATNDITSDNDIVVLAGTSENLTLDFSGSNEVAIGSTTGATNFNFTGTIELEDTTSSTTGVIYKGADRFIHNYTGSGGAAQPVGLNTFIGIDAGNFTMGNTATQTYYGSYNVGVGTNALSANIIGYYNMALGQNSMLSNTNGNSNAAVGQGSLQANTTGSNLVAMGRAALASNVSTSFSVGIGVRALYSSTGTGSVAVGYHAGRYYNGTTGANTTSNYCTLLGGDTSVSADGVQRETVIGYNAIGKGTDTAIIGAEGANDMVYLTGGATINNEELDYDTRVGALSITNALFVQGSDGFVGIGTGTPVNLFDVVGDVSGAVRFRTRNASNSGYATTRTDANGTIMDYYSFAPGYSSGLAIYEARGSTIQQTDTAGLNIVASNASGDIGIFTGGTSASNEAIRIDSSQQVGIGTTAPTSILHMDGESADIIQTISCASATAGHSGVLRFRGAEGTTGSEAVVTSGKLLGQIEAYSYDGDTYEEAAKILFVADGNHADGDVPARMTFHTTPSGSASAVERMRLDPTGYLGINETSPVCNLDVDGGLAMATVAKTANYTTTVNDHTITCGAGNETFTVTLIAAASATGQILNIKNVGTGTITIDGNGAETIDGATTQVIATQYDCITIQSDATSWHII